MAPQLHFRKHAVKAAEGLRLLFVSKKKRRGYLLLGSEDERELLLKNEDRESLLSKEKNGKTRSHGTIKQERRKLQKRVHK